MFTLHNGDCLQVLPSIPSGSIDAIITDLPYGTTACEWDSIIPLAPMWEQVKRVLKPSGVFITTSSQPFTTELIHSNIKFFKYSLVWHKSHAANFLNAKYMPLIKHEDILVFAKGSTTYNPQITKGAKKMNRSGAKLYNREDSSIYGSKPAILANVRNDEYQPTSVLEFSAGARMNMVHPTQKPLDLYRYLIRTYTNEGETVLDICMGSGTTIEAAEMEGRNSIGIEKEIGYFQVAEKRAKQAVLQPNFFTPSNNRLHLTGGGHSATQSSFTAEVIPPAKLPAKSPRR